MRRTLILLTGLCLFALPVEGLEKRIFKSADGAKTFEGVLINYDESVGTVKVRKVGSGLLSFDLSLLSEEDQTYVKEQQLARAADKDRPGGRASATAKHKHGANEKCPVDFDFAHRDSLPQTDTPKSQWNSKWGPRPNVYPPLVVPECIENPVEFKRKRVVAVAKKYVGLPYMHKHIPAAGGLDCSNFTSWVYNFGFGIEFSSAVGQQAETAGRRLDAGEALEQGDLLFQTDQSGDAITHVVIYIDEDSIIDSTKGVVAVRRLGGWYESRLSHARRIIE